MDFSTDEGSLRDLIYPHPNIKDNTLDEQSTDLCCLDNGKHCTTPKYDLGDLDALPLELLAIILGQTDLRSLTDFRRVSRRAMEVVDSIPQYSTIVSRAPDALRGILTIEAGLWVTCAQLYTTLCATQCEQCGDFGGFIYLVTCQRVCFLCVSETERYLPLLRSQTIQMFGLNARVLSSLPQFRSIPGYYGPNELKSSLRLTLIDYQSARLAGLALHGSASQLDQYLLQRESQRLQNFHEEASCRAIELSQQIPRQIRLGNSVDKRSSNPRRFMAVIRAPSFDPKGKTVLWGFHCVGCKDEYLCRPLHWRRKYTYQSFIQHLEQCGNIDKAKSCHY